MGKKAKIDYDAQATIVKGSIETTSSVAYNARIQDIVNSFGADAADTEVLFTQLLHQADEATLVEVMKGWETGTRDKNVIIAAVAKLVPEYRALRQQIEAAEHARKQFETASKYQQTETLEKHDVALCVCNTQSLRFPDAIVAFARRNRCVCQTQSLKTLENKGFEHIAFPRRNRCVCQTQSLGSQKTWYFQLHFFSLFGTYCTKPLL